MANKLFRYSDLNIIQKINAKANEVNRQHYYANKKCHAMKFNFIKGALYFVSDVSELIDFRRVAIFKFNR